MCRAGLGKAISLIKVWLKPANGRTACAKRVATKDETATLSRLCPVAVAALIVIFDHNVLETVLATSVATKRSSPSSSKKNALLLYQVE